MAKNEETKQGGSNTAQAEVGAQSSNRERWIQNMRKKYPDIENEDDLYAKSMDGYDAEHDYAKRSRDEASQLADIINKNPEVASFYSDLASGNIGAAFLNLGDLLKAYMSGEIDDEGYKTGLEERKKADDEKNEKIAAQDEVFKQWCEKHGYDPEEWMQKANEQLFSPMSSYAMAEAQFDAIDKMLNYDEDVEAAEIRGQNANIENQRRRMASNTDGMANKQSAAGASQQRQEHSSIVDIANRRAAMKNL